jgi:hypothetical protein
MGDAAMSGVYSAGMYGFNGTAMNTVENMLPVQFFGPLMGTAHSASASAQSTSMSIDPLFSTLHDPASGIADGPTLGLSDNTAVGSSS